MAVTATPKSREEAPYPYFAQKLEEWIVAYSNRRRARFVQRTAAEQMHINNTMFSRYIRGRDLPIPEHCLTLARYFDVPVDEVLRAAGYLDLYGLREWVAQDQTPRDPREKQYILSILAIALGLEEWQQNAARMWRQPDAIIWRDRAERALASGGDPYIRALDYADAVYDWGHSPSREMRRVDRNTEDLPLLVSGGGR